MLPAIDMINHATEPDKRNTLLRKSSAEMTVKVDGAPLTLHGFFTMKAGQLHCSQSGFLPVRCICSCPVFPTVQFTGMQFVNVDAQDCFSKDSKQDMTTGGKCEQLLQHCCYCCVYTCNCRFRTCIIL